MSAWRERIHQMISESPQPMEAVLFQAGSLVPQGYAYRAWLKGFGAQRPKDFSASEEHVQAGRRKVVLRELYSAARYGQLVMYEERGSWWVARPECVPGEVRARGDAAFRVPKPDAMRGTSWAEVVTRMSGQPATWGDHALAAVEQLASEREEFTSEALRPLLPPPPDPRALGAAMGRARRKGLIEPTDRFQSPERRGPSHGRPQRVWRSLVIGVGV